VHTHRVRHTQNVALQLFKQQQIVYFTFETYMQQMYMRGDTK